MNQYRLFVASFIIGIIALVAFFAAYFNGIMNVIQLTHHNQNIEDPFQIFRIIFSPVLLVSLAIAMITGLLYRVLGIMFVARNNRLQGGEQALWIVGFVLFGFITAIVFMAMSKSRSLIIPASDEPAKALQP